MSLRRWLWSVLIAMAVLSLVLLAVGAGMAAYLPPFMMAAAAATVLGGAGSGLLAGLVAVAATALGRGLGWLDAYAAIVLAVVVGLTSRVADGLRHHGARADRSLALLSVLISALHRVAEAPGARDAEATLPGLLQDQGAEGLLVWRTTYGAPEAVAGAGEAADMEDVAEAVRRVVREKVELHDRYRAGRRVRHLSAVPVFERGDVVAVFTAFRTEPMAPTERAVVREFTETLGHVLTKLHEARSGDLVLQLAQFQDVTAEGASVSQVLLDLVVPELRLWGGAVLRYRAGRFSAESVGGRLPSGLEDRLRRGLLYNEGVVWEAYRAGTPLFIEDYVAQAAADSELAAFGVRALAVVPIEAGRASQAMVTLFHGQRRPWLASERDLLGDLASVLRASLAQRDSELRLAELARLQRELLATPVAEMYPRLLEAAMRLVPGSEAASLLVRGDDELFRYAAVVGFDAEGLRPIRFTLEAMEFWYGAGDPGWPNGEPRVLLSRRERTVSDISALTGPSEELRRAGRVDEIVADLCLPVLYRGEVLAILNLDAMHDPDAFPPAAIEAAAGLAPFIGFLLHESDARTQLSAAARTDELTGLSNRRAFNEQAEQEIGRSVRYGEPLALLVLDLSRFKQVNDRCGHVAGDDALRDVAHALQSAARTGDRLFRWGGDEFAALLSHADLEAARQAADRMADAVGNVHTPVGPLGVNIGVACVPDDGTDVDSLVRVADGRMFLAKATGRVTVEGDAAD
ncbi:MAG: sensor domain-containing diguanylate cyclase [Deinococcales bacterium]